MCECIYIYIKIITRNVYIYMYTTAECTIESNTCNVRDIMYIQIYMYI